MINILILSSGTRNKIIEYFKNELHGRGKVIAADCSPLAPSLYVADKYYVVPKINDTNYIDVILDICKKERIKGVISLIDPELSILAKNKNRFEDIGVIPIVSEYDIVEMCLNKYKFYKKCTEIDVPTIKSYIDIDQFMMDLDDKKIHFPVFVKPYNGSCSLGIQKVNNLNDLTFIMRKHQNLMIQEFMQGKEFGVDVYVDTISNEVISIFIKKKLLMRAGETDKSISIKNDKLFNLIKRFVEMIGFIGQIDIDVFELDGEYYISEVNPRFGGGYLHAYECGCNFPLYIINNLMGYRNNIVLGKYQDNVYMMKYLYSKIIEGDSLENENINYNK